MEAGNVSGQSEGGRQRRVKRDEVRRRLLDAAYRVFAISGYEGASLERVADAAGFSKGAVYSNFANKDELFYELIAARIDERALAVRAASAERAIAAAKGEDAKTAARLAGQELRAMGDADPGWQMLFVEFWLRCARNEKLRIRFAEKRLGMRTKIAELVEAQAAASGLKLGRDESLDMATIVLALSNGLGIEGLIDPAAVRPGLFGEILADIVAPTSRGSAGDTRT
jgi:AcrR family transcriptional regulator